ncbi:MAG: hypothetical protein IIC30_01715 [Chloroflexi bacterium]|nr:hypothetical protein [Chloroflexota bacterium]
MNKETAARRDRASRLPLRVALAVAVTAFAALVLLAGSGGTTPVRAQAPSIEIVSFSAVSKLPDGIEFNANVTGDVEEVTARFTIQGRRATQYDYLDFADSGETGTFTADAPASLTLFYRTDTLARYLPPGVTMEYRIQVLDSSGNLHESEARQIVLTDSRFEWETISRGGVTVYYHGPVRTRANSLLDASLQTIENMAPVLGIEKEGAPINVTMYNNIAEMIGATAARSGAISRELITEGQAFSSENLVLVLGGSARATGTMSHELTHVLLSRAMSGPRSSVPAWLSEGLAEYGNIDPGIAYDRYLEWGIDTGRIPPLKSLDAFPGDPDLVIVSYGQSRDVVKFMVESFGPDRMAEFLAEFNATRRINDAMVTVYGLDLRTLDELWRESVGAPPLPQETVSVKPTARPLPTFVPYTLDNIGAAPTSTPAPDTAVSQPEATAAPEPESDRKVSGGCSVAGPGAPVEAGMVLMILAVGSTAAFRTVRGKSGS